MRTKVEVYRIIKGLAERGIGIIVVSSEMLELRRCATRIICLYAGRVQGEFDIGAAPVRTKNWSRRIFGKTRGNS